MEWLVTLVLVALITLLVGVAFSALGVRGPGQGRLWFFLVLFFATFAIGSWIQPMGPRLWNAPWLMFLIIAVLVGLLIAAASPGEHHRRRSSLDIAEDRAERKRETAEAASAAGMFLWFFVVLAGTVVLLKLLFDSTL